MTINQLESLVSVRPHSPLFARLASEYLKRGLTQEAQQLCEAGMAHHPHYASAHLVLAKTLFAMGDVDVARQSLSRAVDLVPESIVLLDLKSQWTPADEAAMVGQEEEMVLPLSGDEFDSMAPEMTDQVAVIEDQEIAHKETLHGLDERASDSSLEPPTDPAEVFETTLDSAPGIEKNRLELLPSAVTETFSPESENLPASETADEPEIIQHRAIIDNLSASLLAHDQNSGSAEATTTLKSEEIEPEEIDQQIVDGGGEKKDEALPPTTRLHGAVSNDEGRIVSRTLAEIYARQGAHAEAIITYELLKQVRPDESAEFDQRIRDLEQKLQEKPT